MKKFILSAVSGVLLAIVAIVFVATRATADVEQLGPTELTNGSYTNEQQPEFEFLLLDDDYDLPLSYQIDICTNYSALGDNNCNDSVVMSYLSDQVYEPDDEIGIEESFVVGQDEGDGEYLVGDEDMTLSDGSYTWRVRTIDDEGVESAWTYAGGATATSPAFRVDATPPVIDLDAITPNPTSSDEVELTGSAVDAHMVSSVEYRLNGGDWEDCDSDDFGESEVDFTCEVEDLVEGENTIEVRATDRDDATGNTTSADFPSETVTLDTTAPTITLEPIAPNPTNDNEAELTGEAEDEFSTITSVEYRLNGAGDWFSCVSDDFGESELEFTCEIEDLVEGLNAIQVRATDSLGNVTTVGFPEETVIFDATPPSIELDAVPVVINTDELDIEGTAEDVLGTITSVEYRVGGSGGWSNCVADDGTFDEDEEDFTCEIDDLDEGENLVQVRATDSAGNTTGNNDHPVTVTVDTDGPSIDDVNAVSISDDSATIEWTTDEDADSTVEYGTSEAYGGTETGVGGLTMDHSVSLSGLTSCTTYFYQVLSEDEAENVAFSDGHSFTTTGCVGDSPVLDQTEEEIDEATGGTVELLDGGLGIELEIPAGFLGEDAVFQIKKLNAPDVDGDIGSPAGLDWVGNYVYELKAFTGIDDPETSFDAPIQITFFFDENEVADIDLSTLAIFRWDGANWLPLDGCSVDEVNFSITCTTENFSVFGLFGEGVTSPPPTSSSGSSSSKSSGASKAEGCSAQFPGTRPELFRVDRNGSTATLWITPGGNPYTGFTIWYGLGEGTEDYADRFDHRNAEGMVVWTINELDPGATYSFRVQAHNDCAYSDSSEVITSRGGTNVTFAGGAVQNLVRQVTGAAAPLTPPTDESSGDNQQATVESQPSESGGDGGSSSESGQSQGFWGWLKGLFGL